MMIPSNFTFAILILSLGVTAVVCGVAPIQKRSLMGISEADAADFKLRQNKRTFCNAFTGCAGKRSDPAVSSNKVDYEYDQPAGEGNEESMDDVIRDILAEARLYEALQTRGGVRPSQMQQQSRQVGFFPRQKRSLGTRGDQGKNSIQTASKSQH